MSGEREMSFLEHLGELRKRLLRILLALVAGTGVALVFTPRLLKILLLPYGSQLKVIGPTEGVANYLRIAVTAGAVLAMPYILVELWGFVAPALKRREKLHVFVLVPAAFAMFLGGVAFAWLLLIPTAIRFLSGFSPEVFKTEWTSQNYIPFVTALLFWIGVCFELPLVAFFLAKIGVVSWRLLLKGWRYAVVLIFLAAALITPTVDPFNMALVALPLIGLYFLGILLALIARRETPGRAAERPEG
jgi:sec-independent protein translocase protein TatC